TDSPFRSFMREMGCGAVVTELVSANGLHYDSEKTRKLMSYEESQRPVGIQIFGENEIHLAHAAQTSEEMGVDFVDINFGCPVPKVVNKGAGSATLRDLVKLARVLRSVKSAVSIPVTIKIRTGWDEKNRNSDEVVRIAHEEGITWVGIHGRSRAAGYSGRADWEYIKNIKEGSKIPILGNGDISTAKIAVERLRDSGCNGVMIGRGCLKNPWIFREANDLSFGRETETKRDFVSLVSRLNHYLEGFYPERIVLLQLKKFSAWFSSGYPNSSHFRRDLFSSEKREELMDRILEYFEGIKSLSQTDTSNEPFLMGGHG
ncbi:MAG: tRNA-dihydrouridine synthase, partial [Bdellovibrionales bacterium]|nr:tRNA-dihydrouridine synthase [Bdellovibrionales bacterium]